MEWLTKIVNYIKSLFNKKKLLAEKSEVKDEKVNDTEIAQKEKSFNLEQISNIVKDNDKSSEEIEVKKSNEKERIFDLYKKIINGEKNLDELSSDDFAIVDMLMQEELDLSMNKLEKLKIENEMLEKEIKATNMEIAFLEKKSD